MSGVDLSVVDDPQALSLRRPLVGLALAAVAGVACGLGLPVNVPAALAASAAVLLAAWLLRRSRWSSLLIGLAAGLVACAHAGIVSHNPSRLLVGSLLERSRENIAVIGVVADEPVESPGRREGERLLEFPLQVEGIRRVERWERARGMLRVEWRVGPGERAPDFGGRWRLSGLVSRDGPAEGAWGPARYGLRVDPGAAQFLSGGHGSRFVAMCLRGRQACSVILGRGLEDYPDCAGLLRALMLGYRQELPDRLYRAFSTTGTLHVIAISGMHVAIMGMMLIAVLNALGLSRTHWILYLAPALIVYTVGTGMSASAVRACVMAIVFWSAPLFSRRPDGPSALALAALLILAFDPTQLVDLGFVFSFVAVAGLMAFYPPWMRPIRCALAADPWRVQPEPRWRQWGRQGLISAASVLVASAAAWLSTAPLSAYCFNLVSPVALLGNLVVIPLSFVVLLAGVLSLVLGTFSALLAEVFNHANRVFISGMLEWVDWMAAVPHGYVYVRAPAVGWLALWYGLLAGWRFARGAGRRAVVGAAVAALAVIVVIAARDDDARADILDVGEANAAFVNTPGSCDILVDTGPRFNARSTIRYLRQQGVDRLRAVVLSHGDADHIGAAPDILEAIPVSELWCTPFAAQSPLCRAVLRAAAEKGVAVSRLTRGDHGALAGGVEWEILHPPGAAPSRRGDEVCLVVRVTRASRSILFMGDAEAAAEAAMLEQAIEPAATVLVAGNHGASNTCGAAWLDAVRPEACVISVGADNAEGHPAASVLGRLGERGVAVFRTDERGTIRVRLPGAFQQAGSAAGDISFPRSRARSGAAGIPDRFAAD